MDFVFSEEQEAIRDTARRFAEDRLAPDFRQREIDGRIGRDIVTEMGELGLIGADLPEEFGGLGLDCVTAGIIVEEIAAADLSVSYIQLIGSLNGHMLAEHATPDLAAEGIGDICAGRVLTALGLTEPRGGSDAAGLIMRARRDGDDYVLNGEKWYVTSGILPITSGSRGASPTKMKTHYFLSIRALPVSKSLRHPGSVTATPHTIPRINSPMSGFRPPNALASPATACPIHVAGFDMNDS